MTANYLDAIRKFEGFTPKADWDYAQFTNGYGTKAKFAGEVIDKAEADRRFQAEIAQARAIVDRHAPHVDEGTKAALTSLTFNAGDKWARSGLGEAIRSGDTEKARELFLQYNKAGGEVLARPGATAHCRSRLDWAADGSSADGWRCRSGFCRRPARVVFRLRPAAAGGHVVPRRKHGRCRASGRGGPGGANVLAVPRDAACLRSRRQIRSCRPPS